MTRQEPTSHARPSLILFAESAADQSYLCSGRPGKVSVRISIFPTGVTVAVPSHSFLALVQVGDSGASSLEINLPGAAPSELVSRPGEMSLLPPGSTVTSLDPSIGEFIQYGIPRLSIQAFASQRWAQNIDALAAPTFAADSTMTLLSRAARSLLYDEQRGPAPVAEYFTLSLYSHLLDRYGIRTADKGRVVGGLSPTHKRIIQKALDAPFKNAVVLEDLAKQCGISAGHFARAFHQSFGTTFHKHLLRARVKRAEQLLSDSTLPLKTIALQVGYADQATFTESFTRVVGIAPGRYRRRFAAAAESFGALQVEMSNGALNMSPDDHESRKADRCERSVFIER